VQQGFMEFEKKVVREKEIVKNPRAVFQAETEDAQDVQNLRLISMFRRKKGCEREIVGIQLAA